MRSWMIAASLGIVLASVLPRLPPLLLAWSLVCVATPVTISLLFTQQVKTTETNGLTVWRLRMALCCCTGLCLGFAWGIFYGHDRLSTVLPLSLESQDLWLEGTVRDVAGYRESEKITSFQQFEFAVDHAWLDTDQTGVQPPIIVQKTKVQKAKPQKTITLKTVKLSWYLSQGVYVGQRWRFKVRLKRPRSFANPAGFDYQAWLMRHGFDATGYVRKDKQTLCLQGCLQKSNIDVQQGSLENQGLLSMAYPLDRLRAVIKERIVSLNKGKSFTGILLALSIGDKKLISPAQWQMFTNTGTNHLVVISGLHIGLIAGLTYWLSGRFAARCYWPIKWLPASVYAMLSASFWAFCYSALAGFSLPTLRALIMLLSITLARLLYIEWPISRGLIVALLLVLMVDPLAAFASGLWLSFGAVALLLYGLSARLQTTNLWWRYGRPQWLVFCGLAPLLLWFFQQLSMVAPLANVVAIPIVSFLVVPFTLMAVAMTFVNENLAIWLFWLAHESFAGLWALLELLLEYTDGWGVVQIATSDKLTFVLALFGMIIALAPRGIPARYLALLLSLPLFFAPSFFSNTFFINTRQLDKGEFDTYVLDVGQGLAVVVKTASHSLLYDTGAARSAGYDLGRIVVVPFLRDLGISNIDTLVVSHGDNDHAGGLASVLASLPVAVLLADEQLDDLPGIGQVNEHQVAQQSSCHEGMSWRWDGVLFEVLHPDTDNYNKSNNLSCVLRVSNGVPNYPTQEKVLLLSGDIERLVEQRLVQNYNDYLGADILIAPHHGSRTSSHSAFIQAVSPEFVVFSSGYRNQFKHPHPYIVQRYRAAGSQLFNTAETGMLTMQIRSGKPIEVEAYRDRYQFYWQ